jgi:LPS export ABC transporter protein LptC
MNLGIVAAAAALTLSASGLGGPRPELSGARVRQRIEGFELPRYEKGKLVWKVRCRAAEILATKDIRLEQPKLHIVPIDGKPGYDISAKRGAVTDAKKTIRFEEDVRMVSTAGDVLEAGALTWKTDTETAHSESRVSVRRGKMVVSGKGLTADAKSRSFKILSGARLVMAKEKVDPGREGLIEVTTQGALTFKDGLACFTGRPVVQLDSRTTVTSDGLDLHLDMKTETIRQAVGTGRVVFSSQEVTGRSRRAEWTPGADTIGLSGEVVLRHSKEGHTVQAERTRISPDARRMICPGPATLTLYPRERKEPE